MRRSALHEACARRPARGLAPDRRRARPRRAGRAPEGKRPHLPEPQDGGPSIPGRPRISTSSRSRGGEGRAPRAHRRGLSGDAERAPRAPTSSSGAADAYRAPRRDPLEAGRSVLAAAGAQMLARAERLEGTAPLDTLSPEGQILHAVTHTAQDSFSLGLKTAWDCSGFSAAPRRSTGTSSPSWVRTSRICREGLGAPKVLAEELDLEVSSRVSRNAPADARQGRLEAVARRRLFQGRPRGRTSSIALSRQGLRLLHARFVAGRSSDTSSPRPSRGDDTEPVARDDAARATERGPQRCPSPLAPISARHPGARRDRPAARRLTRSVRGSERVSRASTGRRRR